MHYYVEALLVILDLDPNNQGLPVGLERPQPEMSFAKHRNIAAT
jgi:hypothetical protein